MHEVYNSQLDCRDGIEIWTLDIICARVCKRDNKLIEEVMMKISFDTFIPPIIPVTNSNIMPISFIMMHLIFGIDNMENI